MKIKLENYIGKAIQYNGFNLKPRDAYDSACNIEYIFLKKAGWFKSIKPMHFLNLREEYKKLVPEMERHHSGVIDLIVQPEILIQIGFNVTADGMVEYPL